MCEERKYEVSKAKVGANSRQYEGEGAMGQSD